jgi:hypothetical protein
MNPKMNGVGILLIFVITVFGGAGCGLIVGAGAVGGTAGAAVYVSGEMRLAYLVSMEKAWKASEDVISEWGMKATEKYIDNMDRSRVIKGKTKENEDFEIILEAKDTDVTVIKTRVGLLGDRNKAQKLLDEIVKKCKG